MTGVLQIKDGYYTDKITAGYQSKILDGGIVEGQLLVSMTSISPAIGSRALWYHSSLRKFSCVQILPGTDGHSSILYTQIC